MVGYRVLVQVKVEVVNFMARADEINIKGAYALLLQKEGAICVKIEQDSCWKERNGAAGFGYLVQLSAHGQRYLPMTSQSGILGDGVPWYWCGGLRNRRKNAYSPSTLLL